MLCFDATEPSNGNSDRRNYGNNRYIYSNLRQWLNSPAAAGQWYTAQHLDGLVGHERDAVGGVACVVLIGHDPDDRAAVQAAELDLRLVCEVAQFLGHELCLLSVMV